MYIKHSISTCTSLKADPLQGKVVISKLFRRNSIEHFHTWGALNHSQSDLFKIFKDTGERSVRVFNSAWISNDAVIVRSYAPNAVCKVVEFSAIQHFKKLTLNTWNFFL